MKKIYTTAILLITFLFVFTSCSNQAPDESVTTNSGTTDTQKIMNYEYNSIEVETMKLINDYRESVGLNKLEIINHISGKSEEHDFFMIKTTVVSHEGFTERCANIIKVLGASTVGENIAYNFTSPEAVVAAWLKSPTHKANIVGKYTHFGLAIKVDAVTGKNYFTNIFANIDRPQ